MPLKVNTESRPLQVFEEDHTVYNVKSLLKKVAFTYNWETGPAELFNMTGDKPSVLESPMKLLSASTPDGPLLKLKMKLKRNEGKVTIAAQITGQSSKPFVSGTLKFFVNIHGNLTSVLKSEHDFETEDESDIDIITFDLGKKKKNQKIKKFLVAGSFACSFQFDGYIKVDRTLV